MPLVYKILDKSDKMEAVELEKYINDAFQDELIVQGLLKLRGATDLEELLERFEIHTEDVHGSDGYNELIKLNKLLKDTGLAAYCTFSSSIVRGLDYYTGTVFEVFDTGKENIRAIFGGGRYDDLLSLFSDDQLSGIGFGMGVLMLSLFLKTYDLIPEWVREKDYTDTIYITSINEKVSAYSLKIADIIRKEDLPCIVDYSYKNLKAQMKKASELGVKITIILGPNEMEQERVTIKNMVTKTQNTVIANDLIKEIYAVLDDLEE